MMVYSITSLVGYEDFISVISKDSKLSDPHFLYNRNNLYNAFEKKDQKVFAIKQGDVITGLFVWLVIEAERYAEMIIGFAQTDGSMNEMLEFMERHYAGYQADFVINPQNPFIRNALNDKKAYFDKEQQRMIHFCRGKYKCNECIEELKSKWKEEYCDLHCTDTYWTAEKIINAPDRFRVFLAIEEGKVVGYIDVTYCFDVNEPYSLFVIPEKANMGYEKALLEAALNSNAPNAMMVLVDVDNEREIKLYKSAGFETLIGQNSIYASCTL